MSNTSYDDLFNSTIVLQSLPDGVVVCDRVGIVRFINPAASRLLAIDVDAFLGRPIGELPGGIKLNQGSNDQRQYVTLEQLTLRVYVIPVRSPSKSNDLIGSVVFFPDKQREAEQRIDFISGISMDMRASLVSVQGCIDLLLRALAGTLTDQQKEILTIARRSNTHALDLLNDVLDISRLDAGFNRRYDEEIHLRDIVQEVAQRLSGQIAEQQIQLVIDIQNELPPIHADRRHIARIFECLLDRYVARSADSRVEIRVHSEDALIRADVTSSDTSIGEHEQSRMFDRSYNLKLAIAKELVQLHGGRIRFTSAVGQGSAFSFTLPREGYPH
jgi:signal transduction histidine kinase